MAYLTLLKEGNKKYCSFYVTNVRKINNNNIIEYKNTSFKKDGLYYNKINYKKSDKKSIQNILNIISNIKEEYKIDNIESFENDIEKFKQTIE